MILDVRPKKDFEKQHLPRSVNIDISESTVDQYRAWSAWENSNENKKTKKDAENSATNFDSKTGESNSGVDTTQNIPEKPKIETIEAKLPVRARMSLRRRRMLNVVIVSSHGKENSKDHDKARTLASMIRNSRSLKVLTGGFQGFVAQYPFALTSPNLIPWYPTIVLDQFLYLGCEADARLLQHLEHLEVTHILNVSGEVKNLYPNRFEYLQINIPDLKSSQIQKHFEQAIEFINMVKEKKSRVLVHCYQGVSRSASIVIAYLMTCKNWSLEKAHSYLKKLRPMIQPNPGFWKQLQQYEKTLHPRG
eukprot:CAMPEP_0114514542 /NCGR_PEP_ID=MMETSP0109-20121206/16210_1 /TAXON_ID=29199 /ORGANISM="Chlorarachnion reptans, Strain CCCM449" /LENGTH=305 /DNA_ID=CAMNT_0001694591 /DNA_START=1054 /DNA_END=1971 /DNA_ORIENTATION=-